LLPGQSCAAAEYQVLISVTTESWVEYTPSGFDYLAEGEVED
jgi:hypothetical protein